MKVPLIPLYVLTEKSLEEIKSRVRQLSEKQVSILLASNIKLQKLVRRLAGELGYNVEKKK